MNQDKSETKGLTAGMIARGVGALLVLGVFFFLPAGTFNYWQAWVFMAIIFIPMLCIVFFFIKKDPEFLNNRMKMKEKEVEQKIIVRLSFIPLIIAFLLPGFDKRFGWSHPSTGIVIAADILVLLGYGIVFLVFRENRFASRIVEVTQSQKVINTGLYALVRHPMYIGSLLMYIFSPLGLGSLWAVIPSLLTIPVIVARIINEEKILTRDLAGYGEYKTLVSYRLIPGIW